MLYRRPRLGFNLLELMIVLVIMAAATAIVWPNLQKPLRRTSLAESASRVRELLDDAHRRATQLGSAYFVRFETGNNQLYLGTFPQFLENGPLALDSAQAQANGISQLTFSDRSAVSSSDLSRFTGQWQSPELHQLAETVIVSHIRLSIAPAPSSSPDPSSSFPDSGTSGNQATETIETNIRPLTLEAGVDSRVYWLPVLAGETGRDATIRLLDMQSQESIEVIFCAATGEIKILP